MMESEDKAASQSVLSLSLPLHFLSSLFLWKTLAVQEIASLVLLLIHCSYEEGYDGMVPGHGGSPSSMRKTILSFRR